MVATGLTGRLGLFRRPRAADWEDVADALDRVRQRVQQETLGHRGRRGDPLYAIRKVLRTGEVNRVVFDGG